MASRGSACVPPAYIALIWSLICFSSISCRAVGELWRMPFLCAHMSHDTFHSFLLILLSIVCLIGGFEHFATELPGADASF